jgi:hypothetical protein
VAEKSSAGPALFEPPARWRFARWLIQTGRLSEWYDVPQGRGVEREHELIRIAAYRPAKG